MTRDQVGDMSPADLVGAAQLFDALYRDKGD